MKHFRTFTFLSLPLSLLLLASCGSNRKQKESSTETFDLEAYIEAAEAIEPNLDRVDQVFRVLDMVDAGYYDILTNDPYSSHGYKVSYPVAAANLGVYMTDIIYHLYGEDDNAMLLSFQAAQELARYIGIESQFAGWTLENLEGRLMSRDTITRLFNDLLADSRKYNSENEMVFVHTAFLAGSFVEKVHISSSLLKQKMNRESLSRQEESNIRELLVIYMNQLDPATTILYEAFEKQQGQLEGLIILNTFDRLRELALKLKELKPELVIAPVEEIAGNQELQATFGLISDLRSVIVTSNN